MIKILRCFLIFFVSVIFLSCNVGSCSSTEADANAGFRIVCWNVQTFFDAHTSGCEYQDFKNSEHWTEERYLQRLSRLCDFIATVDADVYVFEELENSGILIDIYNQLVGSSWNSKKLCSYGTFAKETDSAIGIGVISKFPLENVKLHGMDIRIQKETQPSGRPIIEMDVVIGNKNIRLLVNHWKSKASGVGEGEIWRQWQENVMVKTLSYLSSTSEDSPYSQNFVVCGDFNKDISAFVSSKESGQCKIHLRGINSPADVSPRFVEVSSPWLNASGHLTTRNGSYYYKETWERIDHFFAGNGLKISGFRVLDDQPWATEEGTPNSYKIYTGEGYSDHLPLICDVFFQKE